MSTVRKFIFDRDFGAPEEQEEAKIEEIEEELEVIIPTFSEEDMASERSEGFIEGLEQGRKEAADATEQKLLETIEQACDKIGEIYNAQAEANQEIAAEMISVSTAISKKMFPDLNARNALGEVERVVQETLKAITEEPRVKIIVNSDLCELLTERLVTMAHPVGLDGKVFVSGDPSLIFGDCRIEWSNGAAIRDSEELWEMIDEIIERNLHGTPDDEHENGESESYEAVAEANPAPIDSPKIEQTSVPETQAENTAHAEPEAPETQAKAPVETTPEPESIQPNPSAFSEPPAEMAPEENTAEINDDADKQPSDQEEPFFTPSLPIPNTLPEINNSISDQSVNEDQENVFIPHIDGGAAPTPTEGATPNEAEGTEEPVRDFEPVSPATTAAILEAQSDMNDDDEPNPTDG